MINKSPLMFWICLLAFFALNSQNKIYKAGEVYTDNSYLYGKMEVRMLAATGSGVISNFFTFKEGSELADTFWEEIDIEVFGKDGANSWQSNLITGQGNSNLTRTEGVHPETGLGQEYHTYTIEWKPNAVTWLVNGEIIREIIGGQSSLMQSNTSLRFNIWNPNIAGWVGAFSENILPVHMFVNWIKFYEWNGTSFSETPTFEDDFNSFDTNTWTKANHTFNENMSDFIPENVTTKDGYLVLSITKVDETGYTGTPPTDTDVVTDNPVAIIKTDNTIGAIPLAILFDASDSYDPNDETLSYFWDFGDGNTSTTTTISNTFIDAGNYTVKLTVTNSSGISNSTTISITAVTENSGNCNFNTPIETPLTSINKSYTNIFVLGENGPNLDNITNFTINWDLNNNGLWQLSMNTNNGQPNWWMDLRTVSTHNFSSSQPAITFNNSGIAGLDGTYFINILDDDLVLVSEFNGFTIYFSYSGTEPNCNITSQKVISPEEIAIQLFPNPSNSSFTVNTNKDSKISIKVYETSGRIIKNIPKEKNTTINFGENLKPGVYFIKIYDEEKLIQTSKIIKKT